jgi:RNA-directed DNA polymerase
MLGALEQGVKGGVWYSLIDKVIRPATLNAAWTRVKANRGSGGVDGQSIQDFEAQAESELNRLHRELRTETYRPQAIKRRWIDKPGSQEKRPLGIPAVRDRVVQSAIRLVIEPIFEREFIDHSYGFRPGRGCKDALRRVATLLTQGYRWVVDADLKGYFDSIPHDRLMGDVRQRIADRRVLGLLEGFLKQQVMDDMKLWTPEDGTPQGGVISPLLSNLYLHPVDVAVAASGHEMVRYADDFVILCRTQEEAEHALALVRNLTGERGLTLHPVKTRIVDATKPGEGFDFLGYHFEAGHRWPRAKSLKKLKETLRPLTKRANGNSMPCIVTSVNRVLKGWFEYFKHSYHTTFPSIDGWIRRRLRSILRKRSHRRGISPLTDNRRWPNAFFRDCGLLSLTDTHKVYARSCTR